MITVKFNSKTLTIKMEGHSDVQKCAGISALFGSLATSITKAYECKMLEKKPTIKEKDGKCSVSCTPKEKYFNNISVVYWTILNGIEMIADKYPEDVKLIVK